MSQKYQVIRRLPLPSAPLNSGYRDSKPWPITMPDEFSSLSDAVRLFLRLANDGVRGLSIFASDDREVIDLREWAPQMFLRQRTALMSEIDALEDGRIRTRDRAAAITERMGRISELDVFLQQA